MRCSVLQFAFSFQYVTGILIGYLISNYIHQSKNVNDQVNGYVFSQVHGESKNRQNEYDVALASARRDRILCWIVTAPKNKFKAQMVKSTWGRKCDKLIFISSLNDTSLPAIAMPIPGPESREQLWNKAKPTLQYVYDNYLNDFDWFFKADDDTYTIMENLREYLLTYDPSKPHFLGRRFKKYLSGGSGYVFSRETLRTLVEKGLQKNLCDSKLPGSADDLILGLCLTKLGIEFADTRDEQGRQRFIPYHIDEFYSNEGANMNFINGPNGDLYPFQKGYNCCSSRPISFHYISGYHQQVYEYLIYQLKVASGTDEAD